MIPAILLTAGLATRLGPLSRVRAKSALPLGGETMAERILRRLHAAGVTDAVLNLHHLPATITARVGDGSHLGVRVRYSWESPTVLGAAGGPRKAIALLDAPTVLVVNGDTLTDFDLAAFVAEHSRTGAMVTLAVVPNTRPEHYSGIRADADGCYGGVVPRGAPEPSYHVIGTQVVEGAAYAGLEVDVPVGSVWPLYEALARSRPGAVRVYPCTSSFLDVGTPADYVATCAALARPGDACLERGRRVSIASSARLQGCILWDDVTVETAAELDQVVVTDGVRVPAHSIWRRVILRNADDSPLVPGERIINGLAVAPLQQ